MSLLAVSKAQAQEPVNIALGKKAAFNKNPNYRLCTDPDDKIQLTDGRISSEGKLRNIENTTSIWVQKDTVGWRNTMPVVVTFDLGSVQPISGVSYSTAAGRAGVTWPGAIYMAVSEDGKAWHAAGDLVKLSQENGAPPAEGYAPFKYVTHEMHTKGRYISFGIVQTPYAFVDEIEVYKGDNAWLAQPVPGKTVPGMEDWVKRTISVSYAQRRINADIATVRELVQKSSISSQLKSTFNRRLDKDAKVTAQLNALPPDFTTILPLDISWRRIHQDVFAVHGELLAAQGLKPITVWKQHRYAWLPLWAKPATKMKPQLNFSMLRDQFRSDALLITNAGKNPHRLELYWRNLPTGTSGWLKVYSVVWTDTQQGIPVADALLPISHTGGVYQVEVPAGMTSKIWFTVDSSKLPAGDYAGNLFIDSAAERFVVPTQISISSVAMNKPRFSTGMWDYTNVPQYSGLNAQNRKDAIRMMRSHFVDTPWATGAALPRPHADAFDAQGNLTGKLDFTNFDNWAARWPGARNYFVFPSVPDSFAGSEIGTPLFAAKVGNWAKALAAHMKSLGLKPSQLGLLLVDEPHSDAQDAIIAAWANAINAAAPELTLFEDPTWIRPDQTKIQDAITQVDILCPNFPRYMKGGAPVKKYFENLRARGKTLWLYQCTGPVRLYSPQQYYRYQPWQAFAIGATGQGFWAFGGTGGAETSWDEYSTSRVSYAPAFIDKTTVYDSVHWNAVREGVEDYEELAMLQDAIHASHDNAWKTRARKRLADAVTAVTASWTGDYQWENATDPGLADRQLQKVREMLE